MNLSLVEARVLEFLLFLVFLVKAWRFLREEVGDEVAVVLGRFREIKHDAAELRDGLEEAKPEVSSQASPRISGDSAQDWVQHRDQRSVLSTATPAVSPAVLAMLAAGLLLAGWAVLRRRAA